MDSNVLLLATSNPAKQHRLSWLIEGSGLSPVILDQLGLAGQAPDEVGGTHEDSACLKAEEWSRRADGMAISSDGGLVIPALGACWDSLRTHRFAGDEADDETRVQHLFRLMAPYQGDDRRASWVEAVAIADRGRLLGSWQVDGPAGLLLQSPGPGPKVPGFWAFSIWYFPELAKTYNQLDDGELEGLNDHWTQLKALVQGFFHQRMGAKQ